MERIEDFVVECSAFDEFCLIVLMLVVFVGKGIGVVFPLLCFFWEDERARLGIVMVVFKGWEMEEDGRSLTLAASNGIVMG